MNAFVYRGWEVEWDEAGVCSLRPSGAADTEGADAYKVREWLDVYLSGREPDFTPPLHLGGSPFQQRVWQLLLQIPYGTTTTYGHLARLLDTSDKRMSSQAMGQAVGRNPVALIVPCHRVVGAGGRLTGYAYGLELKRQLLLLERGERKNSPFGRSQSQSDNL